MKDKLLKLIIGKNLPHVARVLVTALGAFILTGQMFTGDPALDPTVGDAVEQIGVPSAEQVKDGLTIGEIVSWVSGILLMWASRAISYARAKKLDWLANLIGPLIGRSLPSFGRAALVAIAGALARFTAQPELAPEVLADQPAANVIGAVLLVLLSNVFSATEDAKRNPVPVADVDWNSAR